VHGIRSENHRCRKFGHADVSNMACLNHVCYRADGVLDRDIWIKPGRTINIDVVRVESVQSLSQEVLHCCRPSIITKPTTVGIAQSVEFDAEDDRAAVATDEGFPDQKLVMTAAIKVPGVEQCDTSIQCCSKRGDALCAVWDRRNRTCLLLQDRWLKQSALAYQAVALVSCLTCCSCLDLLVIRVSSSCCRDYESRRD
jgi:hypothetical protein